MNSNIISWLLVVTFLFFKFENYSNASSEIPSEALKKLRRHQGQSEFLSLRQESDSGFTSGLSNFSDPSHSKIKREINHSDLYKIAKGKNLIYLLNKYRGLQVIGLVNDDQISPRILGRVNATGNVPNKMYFDETNKKIIVLENIHANNIVDTENDFSSENQSRILIYNVNNSENPTIEKIVSVVGEINDSRMVGNVLYITSSIRPWDRLKNKNLVDLKKGYVSSFKITKNKITKIDQIELSLPTSIQENLGIIEVEKQGEQEIYLAAVLSKSGWGLKDKSSQIEIINISSSQGKVKSVMTVFAKGYVERPQQLHIADDTLTVVSELNTDTQSGYAVETFKFPDSSNSSDKIMDEDEARIRELTLELKVKGLRAKAKEKKVKELQNSPKIGLKGRFVKVTQTDSSVKLEKRAADTLTLKRGILNQSSQFSEVRFLDHQIYVFNGVSFDLFETKDISDGPQFVSRLKLKESIEKAFPIQFNNRNFILGAGWSENKSSLGGRNPVIKLFEVKPNFVGRLKTKIISELKLSEFWANFQQSDTNFEVKYDRSGQGSILFHVTALRDGKYFQGGKIIGFDLNSQDSNNVFAEGGFIEGDSADLRRIFSNPEIDKLQTITDTVLKTYDVNVNDALAQAKKSYSAIHSLELARNVRAYHVLSASDRVGIQIISDHSTDRNGQFSEVRFTRDLLADQEKNSATKILKLDGAYVSSIQTSDGKGIIVVTKNTQYFDLPENKGVRVTVTNIISWVTADGKLSEHRSQFSRETLYTDNEALLSKQTELAENSEEISYPAPKDEISLLEPKIIPMPNGDYLVGSDDLSVLNIRLSSQEAIDKISVEPVLLINENASPGTKYRLSMFNEKLYVFFSEQEDIGIALESMRVDKHFLAKVVITEDGKWSIGEKINVPGLPIEVNDSGDELNIISLENIFHDQITGDYAEYAFEPGILTLNVKNGVAVLRDLNSNPNFGDSSLSKVSDGSFLFFKNSEKSYTTPLVFTPPQEKLIYRLSTNDNGQIAINGRAIEGLRLKSNLVKILKVVGPLGAPMNFYALFSDGDNAQVVHWNNNENNFSPKVIEIQLRKEDMTLSEPLNFVSVAQLLVINNIEFVYDDKSNSISVLISAGMRGICQMFLRKI